MNKPTVSVCMITYNHEKTFYEKSFLVLRKNVSQITKECNE